MIWPLQNTDTAKRLERAFRNRNIDFQLPGFCDHPNFLKTEQQNPRFLEAYAQYIEARPYAEDYLGDARRKIEIVAEAVRAAVAEDGRVGACVDASGMLGRMLDRLGVWNYIAKACLTITFPEKSRLPQTYFYGVDLHKTTAPHAIVVAPPFVCVDVTAKYQAFEENQAAHIPNKVLLEEFVPATWSEKEIAAPEVAEIAAFSGLTLSSYLRREHGNMLEVAQALPARQRPATNPEQAMLKYIIVAVGGVIEPLEGVVGYKPCNRTALQIFNEDVLPRL